MKSELEYHQPDDWLRAFAGVPEKIDLGLERCHNVLVRLGLDTLPYEVISVAGTNGKGSTIAFLDSILNQAGYFTGRYTSPHLQHFNERIMLAQKPVSNDSIIKAFKDIRSAANEIHLSYFEYATIAGILMFAEQGVDVALLEVGLGGRLDAVNAVNADVAIITSIALDHQDWLGDNLGDIAFEKAGIMRTGKPCILSSRNMPESLYRHAKKIDARLIEQNVDYSFCGPSQDDPDHWYWSDGKDQFTLPKPALQADIQMLNASASIAAIKHSSLWPVNNEAIARGVEAAELPGRMQQISVLKRTWLLDVAHNPAAMQVLADSLAKKTSSRASHLQTHFPVVFAMLADKDAEACINILKSSVTDWFICPLDSPRTYQTEALTELLLAAGVQETAIHIDLNVAEACRSAQMHSRNEDTILVCGSFYTVGSALDYLNSSSSVSE